MAHSAVVRPIRYKLVSVAEVDEWLAKGWELYGSPVRLTAPNHVFQAVVKKQAVILMDTEEESQ